jgi:hypothetical protein
MSPAINPDSIVLEQLAEHWQKLAAVLVWKLTPKGVTISHEDLKRFPADQVLLTHGHRESIEFRLVSLEEAHKLAAHDREMQPKGRH